MYRSYAEAHDALPGDATWSCSFGYPGQGGFYEHYRDAKGRLYVISNGTFGDNWRMTQEPRTAAGSLD